MIEGTNGETWEKVWYVSSAYKHHMCPTRLLFKKLNYKFKMIGKEEVEKKFIFSYGIGDAIVRAKDGDIVISNVQCTPEVSLNILSYDLLEEQGYAVKINNNTRSLRYMYEEKKHGMNHHKRRRQRTKLEQKKSSLNTTCFWKKTLSPWILKMNAHW